MHGLHFLFICYSINNEWVMIKLPQIALMYCRVFSLKPLRKKTCFWSNVFWSLCRLIGTKRYASSGLIMYYVTRAFCDTITMYGFYPYGKSPDGEPVRHHYYDKNLTEFSTSMHDFDKEQKYYQKLHNKGQLGLVTESCDAHPKDYYRHVST